MSGAGYDVDGPVQGLLMGRAGRNRGRFRTAHRQLVERAEEVCRRPHLSPPTPNSHQIHTKFTPNSHQICWQHPPQVIEAGSVGEEAAVLEGTFGDVLATSTDLMWHGDREVRSFPPPVPHRRPYSIGTPHTTPIQTPCISHSLVNPAAEARIARRTSR